MVVNKAERCYNTLPTKLGRQRCLAPADVDLRRSDGSGQWLGFCQTCATSLEQRVTGLQRRTHPKES